MYSTFTFDFLVRLEIDAYGMKYYFPKYYSQLELNIIQYSSYTK
jgi:hypothetical protein